MHADLEHIWEKGKLALKNARVHIHKGMAIVSKVTFIYFLFFTKPYLSERKAVPVEKMLR